MKLIILAAGTGSRLRSLTKNKHKCLLKIKKNETIITRLLLQFRKSGIKNKDIVIITGFKSKQIKNKLPNEIKCKFYKNFKKTNNLHTLWEFKNLLGKQDTIISFADLVMDFRILKNFLKKKTNSLEALVDKSFVRKGTMKVKINKKIISKIGKLRISESNGNFLGIMKISKKMILKFKNKLDKFSTKSKNNYYTEAVNSMIRDNEKVFFHDVDGKNWVEVDNTYDYIKAKKMFEN